MTDVWITGIGAWSAAGGGIAALDAALAGMVSCAAPDAALDGRWLGRAPDPPPDPARRRLDRAAQFFHVAATEAWAVSGLHARELDLDRLAVFEGSALGPVAPTAALARTMAHSPGAHPRPTAVMRLMPGAGADQVAASHGATGAVHTIGAGSASGAVAIIEGWHRIRTGLADVVIAGGAEAALDPGVVAAFASAGLLAPPAIVVPCRPFDRARSGTLLGVGAGVLSLESAAHAARRGATPLAIIVGCGVSGERRVAPTPDPEGRGIAAAIAKALADGGPRPGWIKAHGTATRSNDAAECRALGSLLERAPITSLKPLLGHTLGASGGLEAVAAVLALQQGIVPPTLGTTEVDPALAGCRVPLHVESRRAATTLLLSQSLGGRNTAMVIGSVASGGLAARAH